MMTTTTTAEASAAAVYHFRRNLSFPANPKGNRCPQGPFRQILIFQYHKRVQDWSGYRLDGLSGGLLAQGTVIYIFYRTNESTKTNNNNKFEVVKVPSTFVCFGGGESLIADSGGVDWSG